MALCGMKNINLKKSTVKIFGIYYSCNKNLENGKNFKNPMQKIETAWKIWRMRNLTLQGKITIFKILAISKIIHLSSVTVLPNSTITQLNKIHKEFVWNHKRPKIKEKTVINNSDKGGLKDVDIRSKIASLQCSWVKRLFDRNFHEWKIIPLFLFGKYFGKNFKFHGSLDIPQYLIRKIPEFYREILLNWSKFSSYDLSVPSTVVS